jgi:hypothetical protein
MIVTISVSGWMILTSGYEFTDIVYFRHTFKWLGREVLVLVREDDTELPVFVDAMDSMVITNPAPLGQEV